MDHTLTSDVYEEFGTYFGLQFSIPADATVTYSVQCRSTSPPDTWDIGIFTPSEYGYFSNAQSSNAYAPHQGVSTISDGADVPAGDYVLGFKCDNVFESCMLSITLSANY